jgi:uncharacterized protein
MAYFYNGADMGHKPPRKIFVTGGTGYIGSILVPKLQTRGYQVTVLIRRGVKRCPGVEYIQGNLASPGDWQSELVKHDVVINLAGSSIFRRWTRRVKRDLLESRLFSSRNVVDAILASNRQIDLFNASGVGYYGFRGDEELDEDDRPGTNFIADLARQWENEAQRAASNGSRVVLCRFGIVLGRDSGALRNIRKAVQWRIGARLGDGSQWFSWIHEVDMVRAFLFLLAKPEIHGAVNLTTPHPVRNSELMHVMGRVMGRRAFIPCVPAFILELIYREFSTVFLKGQRVIPGILKGEGFRFRFSKVEQAAKDLLDLKALRDTCVSPVECKTHVNDTERR